MRVRVQEEGGDLLPEALGHLGVSSRTSLGICEPRGGVGEGMAFGIAGWALGMMGPGLFFF